MRRFFLLCLTIIAILGVAESATPVFAYSSPGKPTGFVNDFAKVLTDTTKTTLESKLSAYEKSSGNEISVVLIKDMGGDYIEYYAPKLFEEWGIGKEKKDNGILILFAMKEHALRIEVGYGLEGVLPDSAAKRIMENEIIPKLKKGDYDGAVVTGVDHVIDFITDPNAYPETSPEDTVPKQPGQFAPLYLAIFFFGMAFLQWLIAILGRSKSWWAGGVLGAVAGVAVESFFTSIIFTGAITVGLVVLGLVFDFIVSQTYKGSTKSGGRPPWWIGGGGFGGGGFGGGGGGGFGGFGGGSSGGGGASGSW